MKQSISSIRRQSYRYIIMITLAFLSTMITAQKNGLITGKVIDKATGETLIGAIVLVENTEWGTATDMEGNYKLSVPSGIHIVLVKYIGYESGRVSVEVKSNDLVNFEYAMSEAQALSLDEVVVVGTAERSSEVVLNIELKKAPYIASGITSSEIRKTPDRTVGDILRRVTGASIQDGKFVIIRGMNDRYNAGYLDGALLSSTESDRKAFAFDVVPANLIDNLIIIKSGSPELTGDFGGGVIKINTKSVPDRLIQNITMGAQYHSLTTNRSFTQLKLYPGEEFNFLSSMRMLPEFEEGALRSSGSFPSVDEKSRLAEISKHFNHDWSTSRFNAGPNTRLSYSIGLPVSLTQTSKLGVILALNYADTRRISDSGVNTYDGSGQVAGFTDRAYLRNINTGGILHINYVGRSTQINFQNLMNVTSDLNRIERSGMGNYGDALTVNNTAHIYSANRLYNGIISFKQIIRDSLFSVHASLSLINVNRSMPDYRIASYTKTPDFPDYMLTLGDFFNSSTGRFTSSVKEDIYCGTYPPQCSHVLNLFQDPVPAHVGVRDKQNFLR